MKWNSERYGEDLNACSVIQIPREKRPLEVNDKRALFGEESMVSSAERREKNFKIVGLDGLTMRYRTHQNPHIA